MNEAPTRLLVHDRDRDRRCAAALVDGLDRGAYEVDVRPDLRDALHRLVTSAPHVVLLGVGAEADAVRAGRHIRMLSSVPIVAVAARADEDLRVALLESYADDVVDDVAPVCEVVARIARRRRDANATPAHSGYVQVGSRSLVVAGRHVEVTAAEREVAIALMTSPGDVASREDLIAAIRAARDAALSRVIDVHVANLRRKLAEAGVHGVISTVRNAGYAWTLAASQPGDRRVA